MNVSTRSSLAFLNGFGEEMLNHTLKIYPYDSKLLKFCRLYSEHCLRLNYGPFHELSKHKFNSVIDAFSLIFEENFMNHYWSDIGMLEKLNLIQLLIRDNYVDGDTFSVANGVFWCPQQIEWSQYDNVINTRKAELDKNCFPIAISIQVHTAMTQIKLHRKNLKANPYFTLGVELADGYKWRYQSDSIITPFYSRIIGHVEALLPGSESVIEPKIIDLFSKQLPLAIHELEKQCELLHDMQVSFYQDESFTPYFFENNPTAFLQWNIFLIIFDIICRNECTLELCVDQAAIGNGPSKKNSRGAPKKSNPKQDKEWENAWNDYRETHSGHGTTKADFCEYYGIEEMKLESALRRQRDRGRRKNSLKS
jgi:hypothetical protein